MGQYYRPCVLRKNFKLCKKTNPVLQSLCPYDFDNGAKLMEHSYLRNTFVRAMCAMISDRGQYFGMPFVWCGDYADEINQHQYYYDAHDVEKMNEYHKSLVEYDKEKEYKYLVNFSKKQYVVLPSHQESEERWKNNKYTIHPLPLLTAFGNGRGGGDYHGINMHNVGKWAFDKIGITNDSFYIDGFKEIKIEFEEA